jgi:hypothetical protein
MKLASLATLIISLAAISGCATGNRGGSLSCEPTPGGNSRSIVATGLAGRYDIAFEATQGERRGRVVRGQLELIARDSSGSILRRLGGAPHPYVRELFFGSATIDLDAVGAYTEGLTSSRDSTSPGVTIWQWTDRKDGPLQLRLGSNLNRRDMAMLDGAYIDAEFTDVSPTSFQGRWQASLGHTSYSASGYFCGRRMT